MLTSGASSYNTRARLYSNKTHTHIHIHTKYIQVQVKLWFLMPFIETYLLKKKKKWSDESPYKYIHFCPLSLYLIRESCCSVVPLLSSLSLFFVYYIERDKTEATIFFEMSSSRVCYKSHKNNLNISTVRAARDKEIMRCAQQILYIYTKYRAHKWLIHDQYTFSSRARISCIFARSACCDPPTSSLIHKITVKPNFHIYRHIRNTCYLRASESNRQLHSLAEGRAAGVFRSGETFAAIKKKTLAHQRMGALLLHIL